MFGRKLQLDNQKIVPKFYSLNLVAVDQNQCRHLFLFTTAAFSKDEAVGKGLENMRRTNPELFNLGMQCGGFELVCYQELTAGQIDLMFKKTMNPLPPLDIKVAVGPQDEAREEKNRLIKQIIETRDNGLLEANRGRLTEYEMAYIKDTLG